MKNKRIILIAVIMIVLLLVPSTSFAGIDSVINYGAGTYTEENPLTIDTSKEKVVIDFGNKFDFPFYFKISGANYAKYLISVDEEEKVVTFKRIATSGSMGAFTVTPHKKEEGYNYVQPGALYNDSFNEAVFKTPLYKIEANFIFDGNHRIETVLGNSTLKKNETNSEGEYANERVYVFCASGLSESSTIQFSSAQINKAAVVVKETFGRFIKNDKIKKYLVTGSNTIKDITSSEESSSTYTFGGNSAQVVYEFWGVTSEILNDNETNSIEEILTKILLSVGSIFRGVVSIVGGQNLTIDSLIFNQYEDTMIGFWEGGGTYVDLFTSIINGWHDAFTKWTAYILVILLVAVGIRAILLAGTENQKKIQGMVVGWILAAALLYIGPMFLKYAVSINDAFVETLRDQSKYSIYSVYNTDFLERYNIDYDMQHGEDSETVKLEDVLMGLYGQIESDLEANEDELEEKKATLGQIDNTVFSLLMGTVRVNQYNEAGELVASRPIGSVQSLIRRYVNTGHTDPAEVEAYINSIVGEVDISGLALPGFTPEGIRQKLLEYGTTYARVKELEQALAATERAISIVHKGIDLESTMKARAGETYRLVYVLVWYIMIYQLVVLLFIYYKRLITVGVLIVIYPLAVMMYAVEKVMGIDKPKSLSTWTSEYLVNVFVQSVHALVYIMLVEAGLRVFEDDEDNWLLFLFAVFAIFPAEAIIKSILGMKAKSISDAKSSLTASKMLDYALLAGSMVGTYGTMKQVDARYQAMDKLQDQKNAEKDKWRELQRKNQDKRTMDKAKKTGSIDEAKEQIAARNQRRAEEDERIAKKRAAVKQRNERRRKLARVAQPLRNVAAGVNAITTAGALGFDSEDFVLGFSTAGYISGRKQKTPKVDDKKTTTSSVPTTQKKNGDRYSNTTNTQTNTNGASQGNTRAAEQARKATTENGSSNTKSSSSRRSRAASRRYQDQYRAKLASRIYADADVTAGNPTYSISENNEDNDF